MTDPLDAGTRDEESLRLQRELAEQGSPTFEGTSPGVPNNLESPTGIRTHDGGSGDEDELHGSIGQYEIGAMIGQGGFSIVYRAHDKVLDRPLAIKVLRSRYLHHRALSARFVAESKITAQLQHPAIPPVYSVGLLDVKRPYIAMKLVEGRTLGDLLTTKGRLDDLPHLLSVFEQICQAVAFAHSKSIIHRDLKPANIMVGPFGEVQVMDWGLAKILGRQDADLIPSSAIEDSAGMTKEGNIAGTVGYMAPEQARGESARIDTRTDVFGLGGILCAILTGTPPFPVGVEEGLEKAKAGDLKEAFARLNACSADTEVIQLAQRCLAPAPEWRPADASAVVQSLQEYMSSVQRRAHEAELAEARSKAEALLRATVKRPGFAFAHRHYYELAAANGFSIGALAAVTAGWLFQVPLLFGFVGGYLTVGMFAALSQAVSQK
jgi:serine/threonine protein kinase